MAFTNSYIYFASSETSSGEKEKKLTLSLGLKVLITSISLPWQKVVTIL